MNTALFVLTVFVSSLLLFLVQPMVGKHILPWFGGTPAVWLLCLTFFQMCLFAGYAYAHLLIDRVRASRQLPIHLVLFVIALAALPVLPHASWKPSGDASPNFRILSMLATNVAFPFLMLAATGPLLQAWFARAFPNRSPYGLYAVSNAGSLIALITYPFLVEPNMPLSLQSTVWTWTFVGCGIAVLGCAWLVRSRDSESAPAANRDAESLTTPPRAPERAMPFWLLLPACAVVLLMAVTNELCLDVANVPFLWILPLATYLLTFILCFASEKFYQRGLFLPLAMLSLVAALGYRFHSVGTLDINGPIIDFSAVLVSIDLLALFASCMLLHGELYRLRPAPVRLTSFYLCVSGGGALGGLFVALVAPLIFTEYYELRMGVAACTILVGWLCLIEPGTRLNSPGIRRVFSGVLVSGVLVICGLVLWSPSAPNQVQLHNVRNFFGILRVIESDADDSRNHMIYLRHGTTRHGGQRQDPEFRNWPTTYFGAETGIGIVMLQRPPHPIKVGVVGLGVGTLAAYGKPGDRFRFYEINPDVIRIAQDAKYFTYLADKRADVEVVLGDARLSLENEIEAGEGQNFDLLVLDAFSSDSIPVHLLTVEAFELYTRHLSSNGVLAFHTTNRNVDLGPLIFRHVSELEMYGMRIRNAQFPDTVQASSEWIIISRSARYIGDLPRVLAGRRKQLNLETFELDAFQPSEALQLDAPRWTDDYSDLFSVLRADGLLPLGSSRPQSY